MKVSRFISGRLTFQGNVAAAAVAVSFLVIIVALGVSSGFRHAIRDGIADIAGDITVEPISEGYGPIPSSLPSRDAILAVPGVEGMEPVVVRSAVVRSGDTIHGVTVKGVAAPGDSSLTVRIPLRLSEITGLGAGDSMVTYFIGEKVQVRRFRIVGIYDDIVRMDDNLIVYAPIGDMQRLEGWASDEASAIEIKVSPESRGRATLENISSTVGTILMLSGNEEEEGLYAVPSTRRYGPVYDWLDLVDFNVLVILILMTIVAGFNMISGLLIMLFRSIPTIGILKTMGMDNRGVSKVFTRVAASVVLKGMIVGNVLGIAFCIIQGSTHLLKLDPANYFVSYVPVHLDIPMIILADILAFGVIMLLELLPTLMISSVDPAKTVKAD